LALTQGVKIDRRGPPSAGSYGYLVAPGEQVWRGSIVALNAAGQIQRVQTAGSVVIVGICSRDYSNVGNASASPDYVVVERGRWAFSPTGIAADSIGASVYATDDSTTTLASGGGALLFGVVDGIDQGTPYVFVVGS
jgi:hypothetical protein